MEPEVHQISLISEKSVVIYNIYSQEGNYFEGRRVNSIFEWKTHQIQLNNTPKLQPLWNHQPPNHP